MDIADHVLNPSGGLQHAQRDRAGGYHPETVARCWSIMLGTLAGCVPQHRRAQYGALHDEPLLAEANGLHPVTHT